ncbi:MAG: DUF1801 domain-containing protein [Anaerolineaceae bacterium]|nr:DUF1801 domain-containing protein [Anaerolineaceae bacterium]
MIPLALLEKQLKHLPEDLLDIVMEIRDIVERVCPEAVERLDRSGIVYYDANRGGPVKAGICQIIFKQDYLSLEFIHGVFLPDPTHLLQGSNLYKKQTLLGAFKDVPWDDVAALITASAHFDPASLNIKGEDGKTPLEKFQAGQIK